MGDSFSLNDEQKKAFDEILASTDALSNAVIKQEAKFDAFNALIGPDRILTELKSMLPQNFSGQALVVCDPVNSKEVLVAVSNFVTKSSRTPALVLFSSNYRSVSDLLKQSGFSGQFFIIDTVSKSISPVEESEGLFFVDSLRNLTQLQIKIIKIIENNPRTVFVFDSVWVLSLYHADDVITKFFYSLTRILHDKGVSAFYISSDKDGAKKLAQFFDESVELRKFID